MDAKELYHWIAYYNLKDDAYKDKLETDIDLEHQAQQDLDTKANNLKTFLQRFSKCHSSQS